MANGNISPEEKLFRVIQKEKVSPSPKIKAFFSHLHVNPPAAFSMTKLGEIEAGVINKVLSVVLAVATVVVIHYAVNRRPSIAELTGAISGLQAPVVKVRQVEPFRQPSFYLNTVKKRDIFDPVPKSQGKVAVFQPTPALEKFKELAGGLKLKGIAWGEIPKVMIGIEGEGKIYFLQKGQMVGPTGIRVKTILNDKVIISYEGEDMELL